MVNKVMDLFNNGKLLVRAMDTAYLHKYDGEFRMDFSDWVREYEFSKIGLYSLSTTLILPNYKIPTYKSIGLLINSDLAQIRHVSRSDSCSSGNELNGDFRAYETDLKTLEDLILDIKKNKSNVMNEVNVNITNNAYVGLFYVKSFSKRTISHILLAQSLLEELTGIKYPIFEYDEGKLNYIDISYDDKKEFLTSMKEDRTIMSTDIYYDNGEEVCFSAFLSKQK